jgi:hypothetical protein
MIGSNILAGASGQGGDYTIARSLRFRKSAGAYLTRTFSSTGNQQKFTFSDWVKRGQLGVVTYLAGNIVYSGGGTTNEQFNIYFGTDDKLEISSYANTGFAFRLITTQVFRDPSAWYHIVVAFDTTQATDTNRVKVYVNGSQITAFDTATYPAQNTSLQSKHKMEAFKLHSLQDSGSFFFWLCFGLIKTFSWFLFFLIK